MAANQPAGAGVLPGTDVYDEEFYNNLQLAKNLIRKIRNRHDKQICKKWIAKLVNLKSEDAVVKRNRNGFFRYMLQILHKATLDPDINIDTQGDDKRQLDDDLHFMSKWSRDKRTYIAAKPLPGQGALVYMAVTKDPTLGWDHP